METASGCFCPPPLFRDARYSVMKIRRSTLASAPACSSVPRMTPNPETIQLINNELCIRWNDGSESYFPAPFLRRHSPSAQNMGETDILGQRHGGSPAKDHTGVTIEGWDYQGNYAIRPWFSDGHRTGLFSWNYLRELEAKLEN